MGTEQIVGVLVVAAGVIFVCVMAWLHRRNQANQFLPLPDPAHNPPSWRAPETSWEWLDVATAAYANHRVCQAIAFSQLNMLGDRDIYDQYMRASTIQVQSAGTAVGLYRAYAELEARRGSD